MDDASTDEPRSVPSKTPSAKASPARDSDGATVPLKDTIADGGDPASPIESAALRSRVIQLEAELAEARTMAENPSSVELAAARSRSISLEAELESARSDARKSEEAMGGMLRMQRAMSSAQKAKITQLQEQNAQLEARIVELNASLAEARTTADAERQSREELRREAEKFEAHVNDAIESREAQWGAANAHAVNEARAELKAAKELTRKMHVAHAAAKLRWAAERAHIIGSSGSRQDAGVDSPLSLGGLAAARARSDVAGSIPSGGGHTRPEGARRGGCGVSGAGNGAPRAPRRDDPFFDGRATNRTTVGRNGWRRNGWRRNGTRRPASRVAPRRHGGGGGRRRRAGVLPRRRRNRRRSQRHRRGDRRQVLGALSRRRGRDAGRRGRVRRGRGVGTLGDDARFGRGAA